MLGLPRGATTEEIKVAWRDLAKVWHPDRFAGDERLSHKAGENLKRINEAYESLGDYDPAERPRISARIRASVSTVLGMGEIGEPPPAAGALIAPSGPIGARHSRRILGLGAIRATGEGKAIGAPAPRGRRLAAIVLLAALLALALFLYYFHVIRSRASS